MTPPPQTLHATCVAIGGKGVLLLGPPGAGKSDLALRLIDRGAALVSDDGVEVRAEDGRLIARAPGTIAGKIEVRGIGIVEMPNVLASVVILCIQLGEAGERMPPDPLPTMAIAGVDLPLLALDPFEASAPIKVEHGVTLYGKIR